MAYADGRFIAGDLSFRCALGKGGVISAVDKREGDGASPIGNWPIRNVYYRPDRVKRPQTRLNCIPLRAHDGWCDAPADPLYNRPVTLPYPASHEKLWRVDHVYNVICELGFNDDPILPGHGSAIFMHLARVNYEPTEGCVALAETDLLAVLKVCTPDTVVEILG
jgi:L,D-peptidoglycan transpeptidase YkuD (ErfK/YbiS/YcfS/YnhG family)